MAHYDETRETRVETDASEGVLAAAFLQKHGDSWRPVAYWSKAMTDPETRYSIHDKEMLAVVRALEHWRALLICLRSKPFLIVTDHRALEYFMTKRELNARQAA